MVVKKELYKKATCLIREYFSRHGIELTIGFEIEFLLPRPPDENGKRFFGEVPIPGEIHHHHIIDEKKIAEYNAGLKAKVGHVMKLEEELPYDKYEVVMYPLPAGVSSDKAEELKTEIINGILPNVRSHKWAERVSFGGYEGRITPALHTNLGMQRGEEGQSIFRGNRKCNNFAYALADGMKRALHQNTVLMAPFPGSYDRFSSSLHKSYPKTIAVNGEFQKSDKAIGVRSIPVTSRSALYRRKDKARYDHAHWIENRMPSGDCQPYVAEFITAVAAYDSFRRIVEFNKSGEVANWNLYPGYKKIITPDYQISKSFGAACSLFEKGSVLRNRLNELDPDGCLGDQIYEMERANQAKIKMKMESLPESKRNNIGKLQANFIER